ncbi:MAG TPA: ATP synthase F0 subunit B [Desulfobacterales bacterium]|nr:ATP synthase F0 subunit B [Desulfobacterales bacterium]
MPAFPALASGEGGGVTVVPDWSFTLQIANFLFLIFALNILLYRPIRRILKERRDKFKGMESAIQHAAQTVQEKEAAFAKAIKDARARGLKEKEGLVQHAEAEESRLIESINARAQADLTEIREKIKGEADRARLSLQQDVGRFAGEIARKILGRAV